MPTYKLKILDDFKCLVSDCPDNCCSHGWKIQIDKETVAKWENISDDSIREKLLNELVEDENDSTHQKFLAVDGKKCNLFADDGSCIVHAQMGEEYLGNTCRTYPRHTNQFTNHILQTAELSCPEVTRLVLEAPLSEKLFTSDSEFSDKDDPVVNLNSFVSTVLDKKGISISGKIITISRLLVEISNLSQQGTLSLDGFNALCRKANKQLKNAERDVKGNKIKFDHAVDGLFWYILYQVMTSSGTTSIDERIANHPIIEKLSQKNYNEAHCTSLNKELMQMRNAASGDMKKVLAGVGEKFLKIKFRSIGFPLSPPSENHIAAFLFGVLPYCFINLCGWMIFDVEKKITQQDILNVIYQTERLAQHTSRISGAIIKHQSILRLNELESCLAKLY